MSEKHYTWKRRFIGPIILIGVMLPLILRMGSARADGPNYSLRFYGHGVNDIDRVKIQIDDPNNSDPGPPVDVGATDFTLEFWIKAKASENTAAAVTCEGLNWIYGNIVIDRDRYNQGRKFGISIAGGVIVFGVTGDGTGHHLICGSTNVLDENWHHIAVQRRRSDGWMWLYVDGIREAQANGPDGDLSYPDDGFPLSSCQGSPCLNSDPYLVFGAEKHDAGSSFPSYSGWLDELRLSDTLRYSTANFAPSSTPFATDSNTVALYHFDEGPAGPCSGQVLDSSGASGGPSHGQCKYGGSVPSGPVYTTDIPFASSGNMPPEISNVAISYLDISAVVTWITDEPATSRVEFGVSPNLSMSTLETTDYVTSHTVLLNGLSPNTTYVYRVHSENAANNAAVSEMLAFATLASEDIERIYLPVILKLR